MYQALLKEFTEVIKRRRVLFLIVFIVLSINYLKQYNPNVHQIIIGSAFKLYNLMIEHIVSFIFVIILFVGFVLLLKKSENEFQKYLEERYPDVEHFESECKQPIEVSICERYVGHGSDKKEVREISVRNGLEERIHEISGSLEFFNRKDRIFTVDFNINDISVYRGEQFSVQEINDSNRIWNEFIIKIDKLVTESYTKENMRLRGLLFHRTYYTILNKYNYFRIGKFRLPYEVSWLKDQWGWKVRPRVRWHFRTRNMYGRLTYKQYYGDLLRNWSRIIVTTPFILALLVTVAYLLFDFLVMTYYFSHILIAMFMDVLRETLL